MSVRLKRGVSRRVSDAVLPFTHKMVIEHDGWRFEDVHITDIDAFFVEGSGRDDSAFNEDAVRALVDVVSAPKLASLRHDDSDVVVALGGGECNTVRDLADVFRSVIRGIYKVEADEGVERVLDISVKVASVYKSNDPNRMDYSFEGFASWEEAVKDYLVELKAFLG